MQPLSCFNFCYFRPLFASAQRKMNIFLCANVSDSVSKWVHQFGALSLQCCLYCIKLTDLLFLSQFLLLPPNMNSSEVKWPAVRRLDSCLPWLCLAPAHIYTWPSLDPSDKVQHTHTHTYHGFRLDVILAQVVSGSRVSDHCLALLTHSLTHSLTTAAVDRSPL